MHTIQTAKLYLHVISSYKGQNFCIYELQIALKMIKRMKEFPKIKEIEKSAKSPPQFFKPPCLRPLYN
jgi:hypothetical protein